MPGSPNAMAAWCATRTGGPSTSASRYTERLAEAGIEPSVGSKGDSYDNALAETINGLYKAELIHRRAPWKTKESVELATLEWVSWFNHHRLLDPSATSRRRRLRQTTIGDSPVRPPPWRSDLSQRASKNPGAIQCLAAAQRHSVQCAPPLPATEGDKPRLFVWRSEDSKRPWATPYKSSNWTMSNLPPVFARMLATTFKEKHFDAGRPCWT